MIRTQAGIEKDNLYLEIKALVEGGSIPPYIGEAIDGLRHFGNFGAHPIESEATGDIIDVDPGEAEWLLEILESLFDHYFVQPDILKKRREDLNRKLADAGQKPMLQPKAEEDET